MMVQCVGKIGTVHRITDRGDIRVQYDGANNRWTFHACSLTKVKSVDFVPCIILCVSSYFVATLVYCMPYVFYFLSSFCPLFTHDTNLVHWFWSYSSY